jgi:hypothetical protein
MDFLLAWFLHSYDNVVEHLSSNDTFTYIEEKESILNLTCNHQFHSRDSSKNSNRDQEANVGSMLNGMRDKKPMNESFWSSDSGGIECNWYYIY